MESNYYEPDESSIGGGTNPAYAPASGQQYGAPAPVHQGVQGSKVKGAGRAAKAIVAVIIIALMAYAAYYLISPQHASSVSSSSNRVIAMLATHKPVSAFAVANAMSGLMNASQKLNVSYTGSVGISTRSALLGNFSESMPLSMSYQKYYNISRVTVSLSGVPVLGNISVVEILNKTVRYTCTKMPALGILSNSSSTGFQCEKNASSSSPSAINLSVSNLTALSDKLNITVVGVKELSYNKQQCYLMEGHGKVNIPQSISSSASPIALTPVSGSAAFTYNITSCVSLQYGLPLNFSLEMAGGNTTSPVKVSLAFNEVSIGTNTNAQISALPGPIENASGIGLAYPTTTIPGIPSTSNASVANQSSYEYSGMYNGSIVLLTYTQQRAIEDLPDAALAGTLQNFYTNNPAYECLDGKSLNVWIAPSEYPGEYIVYNGAQGAQCAYATLLFAQ
ncbi:MAG: hypothetical protein ACP5UH_02425 [Candidatus Micrarchaeia archaeon]